jgi:CHAD domain-containing protein
MTSQQHLRVVPVTIETAPTPVPASQPDHILAGEPLSVALRRVAVAHLDAAIGALQHPGEEIDPNIHEARTSLKRVRAILRLVRDEIGPEVYRNENVVLRDVGRRLAPARDSHVQVRTLEGLRDHYGSVLGPGAFSGPLAHLRLDHRRQRSAIIDDRQTMMDLVLTLTTARARFAGRASPVAERARPIRDDFSAIAPGLRRVYRRGRRGARRAEADPTVSSLHEWRKRVKYLRYQVEFLEPTWPGLLTSHAERLQLLGELLGNEHDLALLRSTLSDLPDGLADPITYEALDALIDHRRPVLRRRAFTLATALYTETPDAYVDRMASYWRAWRPDAGTT